MRRFKLYLDKDKVEQWINAMCRQGHALQRFFKGVQTFTPCEKGEYIYKIDLLYNWKGQKEDYKELMEESGIEYVCQWYRWVWLRKKRQMGAK